MSELNPAQILAFGAVGLSFGLAFLAAMLLQKTLAAPHHALPTMRTLIGRFFALAAFLALVGSAPEIVRLFAARNIGHGELISKFAAESFMRGDASRLQGVWYLHWYTEKGERYAPGGHPYPCESAFIKVQEPTALVAVEAEYGDRAGFKYWFEGRMEGDMVTLTYWKPHNDDVHRAVGVALLQFKETVAVQTLEGSWHGRTRDGLEHSGTTVWKKTCDFGTAAPALATSPSGASSTAAMPSGATPAPGASSAKL